MRTSNYSQRSNTASDGKKRGNSHSHSHPPACTIYSSTTSVVLQKKQQHVRTASDPRTHPPTVYSSAAARTAAVRKNVHAEVAVSLCLYDSPRQRPLTTLPACRVRRWGVQQYYSSSSTAAVVSSSSTPEAARSTRANDPPTQGPPIMYSSAAGTYSSSMLVRSCKRYVAASYWDFHVFPCGRSGTALFDAPRSPLAEFGVNARSFAGDPEGCCVGRAWYGRAAAGVRVALGRAVPKRGFLKPT